MLAPHIFATIPSCFLMLSTVAGRQHHVMAVKKTAVKKG